MDEAFHREQANNDAAKTVSRILEEDGADMEADFGGTKGGSKYLHIAKPILIVGSC